MPGNYISIMDYIKNMELSTISTAVYKEVKNWVQKISNWDFKPPEISGFAMLELHSNHQLMELLSIIN